jgi:glycosyltransferase involved in cell wall biosynthesis
LAEVVGDAAVLAPPGDAGALAGAIARILDDPGLRERLRSAGPARAAQFTWEACVDQHVGAYERAARAGTRV